MTKQEQIDEMAKYICNVCEMGDGFTGNCSEGGTDFYKRCTLTQETAKALYEAAGYRKVDEFEECIKCPAWSGTDCTRNPYTEGCLDDKVNLKNEIKRLKKENACLLKSCEEKFTFDTTQNKKYSVFNTVRKEFADKLKKVIHEKDYVQGYTEIGLIEEIDELLKEYENDKRRD